jgi:hypothetical protein
VGWIRALSFELTAAMAALDEKYPSLSQHPQDYNIYELGRVGEHNVAIACLPPGNTGINFAVTVATQMQYSFSKIRFRLMVGIGGGAPSEKHDIRREMWWSVVWASKMVIWFNTTLAERLRKVG